MKYSLALVAALASSTAMAGNVTKVKVFDHTEIVTQSIPVTETRCQEVQVPIYQQSQGATGGEALLGAILGGLALGTATDSDKGAAIGAIGGAIIANESAKSPKVTGYKTERHCGDVTVYQNTNVEVYSHSTIRFYIDGKRYVVPFKK
jgi:uncharacterized protein YcfJ